jgi:hypothetical protein
MRPLFIHSKSNLMIALIWVCVALIVAALVMSARMGMGYDEGSLSKAFGLAVLAGLLVFAALRLGLEALHARLAMRSGDELDAPEMSTMTFPPQGRGPLTARK